MGFLMGLKERIIPIINRSRRAVANLVALVIGIFVALILVAATFPTAFSQIFNANTSGWSASTTTLWQLVPLIGVLAIVLMLVGVAVSAFHNR